VKLRAFLKNFKWSVVDRYPELRDAHTWDQHVAAGLRLELNRCPVCSGFWLDHFYTSLASIRIGIGSDQASAASFSESVRAHRWDEVIKNQGGKHDPDNAEACVIRCSDGKLVLLFVHTPSSRGATRALIIARFSIQKMLNTC
jgi:Zn-finger nucleic acid-binding protein